MCQNRRAQFHPWVMKIVQDICSVLSEWLSYLSLTPRACSNSCSSRWCYLIVFSNVVPFSSRLQSFPAPEKISWKIHSQLGQPYWAKTKQSYWPINLTCPVRNLYADQEATVRTWHWKTGWFKIGKGVHQGCIWSPCLFNLYAEYSMQNAMLHEAHAGINIAGRNIKNFRNADDTTLMAESKK